MLRLKAAFRDYVTASESGQGVKTALRGFTDTLTAWQNRTGYQNVWGWPKLAESLTRLHSPPVDKLLRRDIMNPGNEEGSTPFEKVANSLKRSETFTPDLIHASSETLKTMPSG